MLLMAALSLFLFTLFISLVLLSGNVADADASLPDVDNHDARSNARESNGFDDQFSSKIRSLGKWDFINFQTNAQFHCFLILRSLSLIVLVIKFASFGQIIEGGERELMCGSSVSVSSYMFLIPAENRIEEKTHEIKDKDVVIAAKEKTIREKSENIASLETEIAALRVSDWVLPIYS